MTNGNPKVYVGTYAKYNNGSLKGAWLDLTDCSDRTDFILACLALHRDEEDPELMFQDWENIPKSWVSESHLNDRIWEWLDLTPDRRGVVTEYLEEIGDADIAYILDHHIDSLNGSKREWFDQYLDNTAFFDGWPDTAINYFDTEAYLRDCELDGSFSFTTNNVFF
jgi:antirestriction protein